MGTIIIIILAIFALRYIFSDGPGVGCVIIGGIGFVVVMMFLYGVMMGLSGGGLG